LPSFIQQPIKKISKKKQKQLVIEHKEWLKILARCQGLCEYCGRTPDFRGLHPHEEIFRSHLGKLSYDNSKASCGKCHSTRHNIKEIAPD
jgi:5-methylcytosine-specific restriction endonuclease McrA